MLAVLFLAGVLNLGAVVLDDVARLPLAAEGHARFESLAHRVAELGGLHGCDLDGLIETKARGKAGNAAVQRHISVVVGEIPGVLRCNHQDGKHDGRDGDRNGAREAQVAQAGLERLVCHAVVLDVDDDARDVVAAAFGKRGVNECVGAGLWGGARHERLFDHAVGHHRGEAVAAQKHPVSLGDVDAEVVGVHLGVVAQGTCDDGAVGVDARLFGCDLPGGYELLNVRVVVGHAHELALVQQVAARIAHMGHGHGRAVDNDGGAGGAHARSSGALRGSFDDGLVGGLDGGGQGRVVGRGGCRLGKARHGDGACHLASLVATHAVRHGEEREVHDEGVLVMLAHEAHVGARAPGKRARALCGARDAVAGRLGLGGPLLNGGEGHGLPRIAGVHEGGELDLVDLDRCLRVICMSGALRRIGRARACVGCPGLFVRVVLGVVVQVEGGGVRVDVGVFHALGALVVDEVRHGRACVGGCVFGALFGLLGVSGGGGRCACFARLRIFADNIGIYLGRYIDVLDVFVLQGVFFSHHWRVTLIETSPICTMSPSCSTTVPAIGRLLTLVPFMLPRSSTTSAGPWMEKRACLPLT